MALRLLAALLGLAACASAQAQALLPEASADATHVLPVVSRDDGQIEAFLLIGDDAAFGVEPLHSLFDIPRSAAAIDVRRRSKQDPRLGASLRLEAPAGLAVLCDRNAGIAASFGALAERCMLARLGDSESAFDTFGRGAALEGRWAPESGLFDLSFGLSWLEVPLTETLLSAAAAPGTSLLPQIVPAGSDGTLPGSTLEQLMLTVQGTRQFGSRGWLRVEAQHGRNRLQALDPLLPLRLDSSAVSVGAGYGRFSGVVTGRRFELPSERESWIDFDLGLSWRTPWAGRLTIGAENLLGSPQRDFGPLTPSDADHDADTRTPYVRYQQDL